jgi:hypothetical protein
MKRGVDSEVGSMVESKNKRSQVLGCVDSVTSADEGEV